MGWLGGELAPALQEFVLTGAIDGPGVQEELVQSFFGQTSQVQSWIDWFGHYCMHRADRGPVEDWRPDIHHLDQAEARRVRRERIVAETDALFQVLPTIRQVGNTGRPGWYGLIQHEGRPGGLIISEDEAGQRRVWERTQPRSLKQRTSGLSKCSGSGFSIQGMENQGLRSQEFAERPADPPDIPHNSPPAQNT